MVPRANAAGILLVVLHDPVTAEAKVLLIEELGAAEVNLLRALWSPVPEVEPQIPEWVETLEVDL